MEAVRRAYVELGSSEMEMLHVIMIESCHYAHGSDLGTKLDLAQFMLGGKLS
jgi:hypothetical protein